MRKYILFFLLIFTGFSCSSRQSQQNTRMSDTIQYISYAQLEQMKSLSVEEALKNPSQAHKVRLELNDLKKDLSLLRNTQYLSIQEGIQDLPNTIVNLKNLKVLNLTSAKITQLPAGIGNLSNLIYLNISHTKIQDFPESVDKLHKLRILGLNTLNRLPQNLTKLKSVHRIYLAEPGKLGLKDLFKALGELPNLKRINMTQVKELPDEIADLKSLEEIIIPYSTHLNSSQVFQQLSKVKTLKLLAIHNSKIDNLPESFNLLSLETLDLRTNNLTNLAYNLKVISRLKNLRLLHIGAGTYTQLPSEIGLLTNLEELYVWNRKNSIKSFPQEIVNLTSLKKIIGTNSLSKEEKDQLRKWLPKVVLSSDYDDYAKAYDFF